MKCCGQEEEKKKMAEAVIEVAKKYRGEFEETYEGLRKRATELQGELTGQVQQYQEKLQQLQPSIQQQRDELLNVLQDVQTPVEDKDATTKLMEALLWTATMQFAYQFSSVFIGGLFSSVIGLFFSGFGAFLLAYAILPALVATHVKNSNNNESDVSLRFKILGFAVIEGILNGYLISDRYLGVWQPLPFVPTAVIAALAPLAFDKFGKARTTFLGATVGAGFGTLFVLGLFTGNLSMAYLLISIFYAAIGFVTIQFFLKYFAGNKEQAAYYVQLGVFIASLYASGLVYLLLGTSGEVERHRQAVVAEKLAEKAVTNAAANGQK
uniref:Uncharacterized protein n=1 Tax=Panagrolaimus sp. JU765 TaxID=591449 RepID=A0AC34RPT4_9BILA